MNAFSKIVIIILAVISLMYIKDKFFSDIPDYTTDTKQEHQTELQLPDKQPQEHTTPSEQAPKEQEKILVNIFYTSEDGSLKKATRTLPTNANKFEYAITELIKGPNFQEKKNGYASEIPKGTKILRIKDQGGSIIIDLSDEFQYGGGTESQYKRVNQLIKTALKNTDKPVYLYINGQKAEVIGGEGIIITQPLSETSLNG